MVFYIISNTPEAWSLPTAPLRTPTKHGQVHNLGSQFGNLRYCNPGYLVFLQCNVISLYLAINSAKLVILNRALDFNGFMFIFTQMILID
jgi:hypothetical protein